VRLVYSELAITDLQRLRAFIAEHDPHAAERVAQDLVERLKNLARFPRIGVPVRTAPDSESVRDLVLDHDVIRYAWHNETVVVLRLWHHREAGPSRG